MRVRVNRTKERDLDGSKLGMVVREYFKGNMTYEGN